MKKIKVGLLDPNQNYITENGTNFKMLSDPSGSTKSRNLDDGGIEYPDFNEIVEIEDEEN